MSDGWQRQTLADALDVASGQVDPTSAPYSHMPHVGGDNIESGTGKLFGVSTASELGLTSGKYLFTPDDVLYSKIRPNLNKVTAPNFAGICSADIYPLRPRPEKVTREFLVHLLRSSDFLEHTAKHSSRTNIPKVNREALLGYEALLPPIAEQRRIAEVLDRAEALRTKRRAALAQLDTLTQSIFLDLFGDPMSNPKGWAARELQEVVREGTVVTYGIVQAGDEYPHGIPYIRTGDIVDGQIEAANLRKTSPHIASKFLRSRVQTGDIVMSIRATVGTTALVPRTLDGANLTQGTAKIAPGAGVNGNYLLAFLRTHGTQRWIGRQVKGATFREITLARLRQLPVLVPPSDLQEDFANRIAVVEKLKSAQRASLAELDALFASLQHRAFRGEL